MSDLISRKALLKALRKEKRECEKDGEEFGGESILFAEAFEDVIDMVKRFPTVDAVPVVRCKDCKYRMEPAKMCISPMAMGIDALEPEDDDFCSRGERRDEA